MPITAKHKIAIMHTLSRVIVKGSVLACSCGGYIITKKGAILSGDDWCSQGFHVHCPRCGRVVAQFVDPKTGRAIDGY